MTSSTPTGPYDLLVVGGGINGVGIARDAVGRGLSVLLCERDDLAGHTSAASSKLIHGGLRYLEQYEFRLVREALGEREVLLRMAPQITWPLRFVLPHDASLRPRWLLRAGLFLYDHLDWGLGRRRTLPGSHGVRFGGNPYGGPLKPAITDGFVYSDCWVEDSRLVVLNAKDVRRRGGRVLTRTALVEATPEGGLWRAVLDGPGLGDHPRDVCARALVNAAGPWVIDALSRAGRRSNALGVRLVKGSHIVVPRLYEGEHAYILQNDDRRIIFVIPYEGDFSLIGTTDVPLTGETSPGLTASGGGQRAIIDPAEIDYLCRAVGRWFARPPTPADVVWTYSGIRPLYDDKAASASMVTRDYVLHLDRPEGAPLLSIFGGKITTYRRLAEHALEKLAFPDAGPAWTAGSTLPGGDLPQGRDAFARALAAERPWLPPPLAQRLVRAYGSETPALLGDARSLADLGQDFGHGLTTQELDWLRREEWAWTGEDVLWRRSKLGLHLDAMQREAVAGYMEGR